MSDTVKVNTPPKDNESSALRDFILSLKNWGRYLLGKWYWILIFGIVGAGLGFLYANSQKPIYTATTSFVLETGGGSTGLSQYTGLAALMGIDMTSGGGGLFQGENIIELYKSKSMITQTLLSEAVFDGRKQLLIDRYIDGNELRKRWKKPELKNIKFTSANIYDSPSEQLLHDSIILHIVKSIDKANLAVLKPDKRLNIIKVSVVSNDELFAKAFNESIVQNVNEFYLKTKTKKAKDNVGMLQKKVDSIKSILSGAIYHAAQTMDATPNLNPTRQVQRLAPVQISQASAEVNKAILSQLIQNLELSKISLQRETPLIQVVDNPILPLDKEKVGKLLSLVIGGVVGVGVFLVVVSLKRFIKNIVINEEL